MAPPAPSFDTAKFGTAVPGVALLTEVPGRGVPDGQMVTNEVSVAARGRVTLIATLVASDGMPRRPATVRRRDSAAPNGPGAEAPVPSRVSRRRAGSMPTKTSASALDVAACGSAARVLAVTATAGTTATARPAARRRRRRVGGVAGWAG